MVAGLSLIVNLRSCWPAGVTWAKDLHESVSAINNNQMQNCHASIQEHAEET